MSIVIKIDRPALHALIANDPDTKLELTHAVVSEIVRKVFDKDIARLVREAEKPLFERALEALQKDKDVGDLLQKRMADMLITRSGYNYQPTPAVAKMLAETQEEALQNLRDTVGQLLNNFVTENAERILNERLEADNIDERIAKRVDRLMTDEVNKRVDAALAEKMAAIRGVVS